MPFSINSSIASLNGIQWVATLSVISTLFSTATAEQFAFECQGTEVRRLSVAEKETVSQAEAVRYEIQIDKKSNRFCLGDCKKVGNFTIRESFLWLRDEDGISSVSYFKIDLTSGRFVRFRKGRRHGETFKSSGACIEVPFRGFQNVQIAAD